ncbi:GMC oxidoreductase-domain-containing protein [Lipomyces orientalis]|uniref:GMC oxidoreductase-domain-containing protein n=1 Tax=Lipomyces orientalis TaxID=1233043 RepID=A0ACC3TP72_9ASCO
MMDILTNDQWRTLLSIADAIVPSLPAEALIQATPVYTLTEDYKKILTEFAVDRPSDHPNFKRVLAHDTLPILYPDTLADIRSSLNMLNHATTCLILTGTYKPFHTLSVEQRQLIIDSWGNARLSSFRRLYRGFFCLTAFAYLRVSDIAHRAMRHPIRDPNLNDAERYASKDFYRFHMLTESDLRQATFDAVIIGSGCGAGVVAARLSRQGLRVLVIEKGKYYHQEELTFSEDEGLRNLYEGGGVLQSEDGGVNLLAGSTFGGGSTVNWSASLCPQGFVRREWALKHGAEFYVTRDYEDALRDVCDRMGVSDNHLVHSRANQILLDGSAKIGSTAHTVAQNTGGFSHRCCFCAYGCRFGEKQGGINTWLVDAANNGAKFMDNATVEKVVTSNGAARGVDVTAFERTITIPASVVVVAAGALNTPVILMKSGFKNRNIGSHLKLHPVGTLYAIWNDKDFDSFNEAILTTVNTDYENIDGDGHGVKIECVLQQPVPIYSGFPWRGGESYKEGLMKYNNMATYISLARDKGEGRVYPDPVSGQPRISYELSKFDRNSIIAGLIRTAEFCLAENVDEIHISDRRIPPFIPTSEVREKGILSDEFNTWADSVRKYGIDKFTSQIGSAHQMSTCRIGSNPKTSAATSIGELWECKDVFVADASALPSASGVNPMISIMATAHVIAGNIVKRLQAKNTSARL